MRRAIYSQLLAWKNSPTRKPLMLYGARQVGKTYILKELGRNEFKNLIYINCYKNEAVKTLFHADADVNRILLGLSAISGEKIDKQTTLLFLDEVQEIPDVVSSLKYFCEEAPEYAVAVAGSLLGVMNMKDVSFPTGKVDIIHLYPMTFIEFLCAVNEARKADLLLSPDNADLWTAIAPEYIELLRRYYFVGGMPEAVVKFLETRSPADVRKVQKDILLAYNADIAKHAGPDTQRARLVFESIPRQLSKENKKYIFGALRKGARGAEYEKAIQWLVDASLIYKVPRVSKVGMPLSFYDVGEGFKLFLLDVGLLGAMAEVPAAQIMIGDNVFSEFKGAFTENYVCEQLIVFPDAPLAYYSKDNSTLEIDFLVQGVSKIYPIEVKAEKNVKSKSLRQFITIDNAGQNLLGLRFSMEGFEKQDWMTNIPLFAVEPFMANLLNSGSNIRHLVKSCVEA